LRGTYSAGSESPAGNDWPVHKQKILNLYALAQTIAAGYPKDADSAGIVSVLFAASADLAGAIASLPSAAATLPKQLIDATTETGKAVVRGAAGIIDEAAKGVKQAADDLIPWPLIGGAVLIGAGLIFGLVYMAKNGVKVPTT
jgi:hypothetical protein